MCTKNMYNSVFYRSHTECLAPKLYIFDTLYPLYLTQGVSPRIPTSCISHTECLAPDFHTSSQANSIHIVKISHLTHPTSYISHIECLASNFHVSRPANSIHLANFMYLHTIHNTPGVSSPSSIYLAYPTYQTIHRTYRVSHTQNIYVQHNLLFLYIMLRVSPPQMPYI